VTTPPLQTYHQEDGNIVVAGDLHGDPFVLLCVLYLSGAVNPGAFGWEGLAHAILNPGHPVDITIFDRLRWKAGARTTLVLSGLVGSVDGSFLPLQSDDLLLRTLYRLKTEGKQMGSDVRWVLGSYDMASTNHTVNVDCHKIIHDVYCDERTGRFSPERCEWVREWIRLMDAEPVVVIDGIAFAHGSLSSDFLDQYDDNLGPERLLASIAKDYRDSVTAGERVSRIELRKDRGAVQIVPDRCRLACDQAALRRLGCHTSFSWHTTTDTRRIMLSTYETWEEAPEDTPETWPHPAGGPVQAGGEYHMDIRMVRSGNRAKETDIGCAILRPSVPGNGARRISCRYMVAETPGVPGWWPVGSSG
jgi:hypothetical protein